MLDFHLMYLNFLVLYPVPKNLDRNLSYDFIGNSFLDLNLDDFVFLDEHLHYLFSFNNLVLLDDLYHLFLNDNFDYLFDFSDLNDRVGNLHNLKNGLLDNHYLLYDSGNLDYFLYNSRNNDDLLYYLLNLDYSWHLYNLFHYSINKYSLDTNNLFLDNYGHRPLRPDLFY